MLKNADCTIFENSGTATNVNITGRHCIEGVYWNDSRGATVGKNGIRIDDSVLVYIYDDSYLPKKGDFIVKGVVDFEFDGSSQKSVSESMKQFREQFPDFAVVKSVSDCRYGRLPHIEVTAR